MASGKPRWLGTRTFSIKDEEGVSSIVAIIALMGMSIALVSTTWLILSKFGIGEPIEASLNLQKTVDKFGDNILTVTHEGGDPIREAFEVKEDGAIEWRELEIRINGLIINVTGGATFNGKDNVGLVRFDTNDSLKFPYNLESGDWIKVVYRPTSQTMIQTQI